MHSVLKGLAGAGAAALLVAAFPALAQDADAAAEIPAGPTPEIQAMIDGLDPEVDVYFWCASAFSLIGSVSENPAETEGLSQVSGMLLQQAREALPESEVSNEDFAAIGGGYNLIVLAQFEAQDDAAMSYSPNECFEASNISAAPAPGEEGAAAPEALTDEAPAEAPAEEAPAEEAPADEAPADEAPADEAPADDADAAPAPAQ